MPHKTELSWFAPRKCWKKKHRGKVYYLGPRGVNKTNRDAYRQALDEWQKIKARLNDEAEQQELEQHAGTDEAKRLRHEIGVINQFAGEMAEAGSLVSDSYAQRIGQDVARLHLAGHPDFELDHRIVERPASVGSTIGSQIDRFLDSYRTQAKLGNRSLNRADNLRRYLHVLREWQQGDRASPVGDRLASEMNADVVAGFYDYIASKVADEEMAAQTGHSTFTAFKQFVRWCWERELCDLPRNLDSKLFRIEVPPAKVQVFTAQQVQTILEHAPPRPKLYALLALNCGMTAKDIADLEPGQVNWSRGTVTRRRSKTKNHKSVPTVTYTLWPETHRLLKEHRAKKSERLLMSENGLPLVRQEMKDNGKMSRVDVVRLGFRRVLEKIDRHARKEAEKAGKKAGAKLTGSFKQLRSTSATLLDNHPEHHTVVELWLGHTPKSVKDRHYIEPTQARLDEAIAWLGRELDITSEGG